MSSIKSKFQKWLKKTDSRLNDSIVTNNSSYKNNQTSNLQSDDLVNQVIVNKPLNFNEKGELNLFENDSLQIFVQKATHQRRTRFQLQDSLFKIKIINKHSNKHLLLKDLLEVFDVGFKFILSNIKTFFKAQNHHIAYLTLYQEPMINGINTGKHNS